MADDGRAAEAAMPLKMLRLVGSGNTIAALRQRYRVVLSDAHSLEFCRQAVNKVTTLFSLWEQADTAR
jgi:hypothetical protein